MATVSTAKRQRPANVEPIASRSSAALDSLVTVGDLLRRLGVPASRVRLRPTPGTATEKDLIAVLDHEDRLCELVDGTLVQKPLGYEESEIAVTIILVMGTLVRSRRVGALTGADGMIKLFPDLVRIPDVAFASWDRFPGRKRPRVSIPHLAPDLVVEVLSKSNTRAEMKRKPGEYFDAGVRLVWLVDPRTKTVRLHSAPDQSILLKEGQSLAGGDILPGFSLSLAELFALPEA